MNELEHTLSIEEKRWFATLLFFHRNGNSMIFFWPIRSFISLSIEVLENALNLRDPTVNPYPYFHGFTIDIL